MIRFSLITCFVLLVCSPGARGDEFRPRTADGVDRSLADGVSNLFSAYNCVGDQILDSQATTTHLLDALNVLTGHVGERALLTPGTLHL